MLLDKKSKRIESCMWAEVSHDDKPYVKWASTQTLENVISQFRFKYNVELIGGQIGPNNFDVTRIS